MIHYASLLLNIITFFFGKQEKNILLNNLLHSRVNSDTAYGILNTI